MENQARTETVYRTLLVYQQYKGHRDGNEEVLSDILTDLMHWADEYGVDFTERLFLAEVNYAAETEVDVD